jgi:hypothetical protein
VGKLMLKRTELLAKKTQNERVKINNEVKKRRIKTHNCKV